MNKSELTAQIAERTGLTKSQAQKAVDAIFDVNSGIITETLRQGAKLQITGFGSFERAERAARTGRNPQTGAEVQIPASTSAKFSAGKGLKDALKR